jgi:pimeloyl-ACP methyl ester carboxylesterase
METTEIIIPLGDIEIKGNLNIPSDARALIIFSHGSGSSRFSRRNNYVAALLNKSKIATLLTDLLTEDEDEIYENRFDVELLTQRLVSVTNYVSNLHELQNLPIGYFGASTGAASAFMASARYKNKIKAIVSRGGRLDLAGAYLQFVTAPTLLIVGSLDPTVMSLNERAFRQLCCTKELDIVNGATHLFEEPHKLDEVAELAAKWFTKYLFIHPKKEQHAL